jgi:hypothetical protein
VIVDPGTGKLAKPVAPTRLELDTLATKVETDRPEANLLSTYWVVY